MKQQTLLPILSLTKHRGNISHFNTAIKLVLVSVFFIVYTGLFIRKTIAQSQTLCDYKN